MSDDDCRQQQEDEHTRMRHELDALVKLERYGMHELAEFFAADLGLTKAFHREINSA